MKFDNLLNLLNNLLTYPGNGVYTVQTAKEYKDLLTQKMYDSKNNSADLNIESLWRDSLENLEHINVPVLLGICSDCGGGIQRGANWGPLFVRSKLVEHFGENYKDQYFDLGDIRVIPHLLHDSMLSDHQISKSRKALYDNEQSPFPVSPLSMTELVVENLLKYKNDLKLFSIGGDHSVSYPLVKPFLRSKKESQKRVGLIHFDAHTDLLIERLGVDYVFGSWTYHILDDLTDRKDCIQIGIRSSGKTKEYWESTMGVQQ